jgi:hypothetical protein
MESKKQVSCARKCRRVWSWMVMLFLWASLILIIISASTEEIETLHIGIGFSIFFYIAYIITAFCSPTFSYLFNKHKADSIHDYMKGMFYTAPKLTWHIECYHYETRVHHHKNSDGSTSTTHERVKIVTHTASEDFHYYSWRDISGLFLLDSHKVFRSQKKIYIKLELDHDVDLADDITKYDYQRQKDDFYSRHRWRDVHVDLSERRHIPGLNQFNMVRISNVHPPCVNKWMYLLFVFILPLVEFYKMYVEQFCINQDYKIKKVISTRFNLNQPQHFEPYQHLVPALVIFEQPRMVYNEQTVLIHDTPSIPTLDELDEAKKFSNGFSYPQFNQGGNVHQNYQPHFQVPVQQGNNINQNIQYTSPAVNPNFNGQNMHLNQPNLANSDVNLNMNLKERLI